MQRNIKGGTKVLGLMVLFLIVLVAVQSFFLYRLYERDLGDTSAQIREETRDEYQPTLQRTQRQSTPRANAASPVPRVKQHVRAAPFASPFADDWNPFAELQRMREEMDHMFGDSFNRFRNMPGFDDTWPGMSFSPDIDLQEEDDRYIVRVDVPGAEEGNINVEISDRTLTLSGTQNDTIREEDGGTLLRLERRSGTFQRALTLPGPVDESGMEANYDKGVLTVTVPKLRSSPHKGNLITL